MATSTTMNVFKTTKSLFKEILTEVFTEVEKIRKESKMIEEDRMKEISFIAYLY